MITENPNLESDENLESFIPFPTGKFESFVCGNPNGDRIRVRYYKSKEKDRLEGKAWFGLKTEGPPGYVHGGAQAALLDEMMGCTAWANGYKVVAADIHFSLNEFIPLKTQVQLEGQVSSVDGRKVSVEAWIKSMEDKTIASAKGLFIVLKDEQLTDFMNKLK